jgi:bifunctional non-homologous end joining protein LigD
VSTPIRWEEVDHPGLKPDGWTIRTIFERLDVAGDPWSDFFRRAVALSRAQRQLESLHAA